MAKDMCIEAGIAVKTNHSLRATGASALFQSSVPEKIIQSTTGHHSLDALRVCEKTSVEQHQAVLKVLMSGTPTTFSKQVCKRKEVIAPEPWGHSVLNNLTNCSIWSVTVNITPGSSAKSTAGFGDEIKENCPQ